MVERSKRVTSPPYKKVFTYGLAIVLGGELVGLTLYLLSTNSPGGFFLLLYFIVVLVTAVQLANRFEMKGTFVYAAILAIIGGCSTGGAISDYREYMRIPHAEDVRLTDLIENPAQYDAIELFYFNNAKVAADMPGTNSVDMDPGEGTQMQGFKVYPLIPVDEEGSDVKKVGAWIVGDPSRQTVPDSKKFLGGEGLSRVTYGTEPYFRAAVRDAEEKHNLESDWNAPILMQERAHRRPKQFFWVIFLAVLWPSIWVITRFNLLLKK